MKKRLSVVLLALAVLACMPGCVNKAEEPVKEEIETTAAEKAQAYESEPEAEKKEPENVPEKDESFIRLYMAEATRLYTTVPKDKQDSRVYFDENMNPVGKLTADQFALINIDDDDIPELLAVNKTDPEVNTEEFYALYTVHNGRLSLLDGDSFGYYQGNKPYFGYYDRENVVVSEGGDYGDFICYREISNGSLSDLADFYKTYFSDEDKRFFVNDEEVFSQEEYDRAKKDFEDKLGTEILVEKDHMQTEEGNRISYMTYDEIIDELRKMRTSLDASESAEIEPWRLSCRNLLYEVFSGVVQTGFFGDRADYSMGRIGKFKLQDMDGDDIPEILVSGTEDHSYWNIYRYEDDSGYVHIGDMQYHDEESDKYYSIGGDGGPYLVYYSMIMKDGELIFDTGMDGTVDFPDHSWIRNEGTFNMKEAFQNGYFDGSFYGNGFYNEDASEEEWEAFEAGYEAGLEKYGVRDGLDLTLDNINKELGFPVGIDGTGNDADAEDGEYTEEKLNEGLDSIILSDGKTAGSLGYNWMWLKERDKIREEDSVYSWPSDHADKSLYYGLKEVDWDNDGIDEYCYLGGIKEGLYFDLEGDVLIAVRGFGPYGMGWNDVVYIDGEYWIYGASGEMAGKIYEFEKFNDEHIITDSCSYEWDNAEFYEELTENKYYKTEGHDYANRTEISESEFDKVCGDEGWIYQNRTPDISNRDPGLTKRLHEAVKEFYSEKRPALSIWGGLQKELYTITVIAPDGYVNLRTDAGTDHNIITTISNGETLPVYEESKDGRWLYTEYQGSAGWVASSQVTAK